MNTQTMEHSAQSFTHFPPELLARALGTAEKLDERQRETLFAKMKAIHGRLTPKAERLRALLKESADDLRAFQKEHIPALRKGSEERERKHKLSFLERFFR